jgi:hypothetical protein
LPLHDVTLDDWDDAVSAFSSTVSGSIAMRGGALLDGAIAKRWQLAPERGERLMRDLVRATAFSSGRSAALVDEQARRQPTRLGGNLMSPRLYLDLQNADITDGSFVTAVNGPKLWRSAEPGDDPVFASQIADDIAAWVKSCVV